MNVTRVLILFKVNQILMSDYLKHFHLTLVINQCYHQQPTQVQTNNLKSHSGLTDVTVRRCNSLCLFSNFKQFVDSDKNIKTHVLIVYPPCCRRRLAIHGSAQQ